MILNKSHICPIEISFDLLDPGNAVYHPNYLVLCDRARSQAFRAAGYSIEELWKDGYALVVRENHSEYFKPIFMGQSVSIITTLNEATGASLSVRQQIVMRELLSHYPEGIQDKKLELDKKQLIHQVDLKLVCVQLSVFRPARFPEKLSQVLGLNS